jgi:uncharacterized protein (DUF302 family)
MARGTQRIKGAVQQMATSAAKGARKAGKAMRKELQHRRVKRTVRIAGKAAVIAGAVAAARSAADEAIRSVGRRMVQGRERALGFEFTLGLPLEAAIRRVTEALKAEGFGILTRIDAHQILQEKLGVGFRPYVILGACNPSLAYRALSARAEAGLLLPCGVTVESAGSSCIVRIGDPLVLLRAGGLAKEAELRAVAREARSRLRRAAEAAMRDAVLEPA